MLWCVAIFFFRVSAIVSGKHLQQPAYYNLPEQCVYILFGLSTERSGFLITRVFPGVKLSFPAPCKICLPCVMVDLVVYLEVDFQAFNSVGITQRGPRLSRPGCQPAIHTNLVPGKVKDVGIENQADPVGPTGYLLAI